MAEDSEGNICQRIAQVRMELDGPRGKSRFAKRLGISPSTYATYESSRNPPAELLVKIADLAEIDLRWLITGTAAESGQGVEPQHPAVRRAAKMLDQYPAAADSLVAFLDILAGTLAFPPKGVPNDSPAGGADISSSGADGLRIGVGGKSQESSAGGGGEAGGDWIPILGRSAAGISQYWAPGDDVDGLTTMTQLVEKHKTAAADQMDICSGVVTCDLPAGSGESVQIITLRDPDESGVVEFVRAARIKSAYKDAFALRIDGDSMSPEIRHGDLLILSPSVAAIPPKPAVVQLRDAIGVTCKLYQPYQPSGDVSGVVNLVPINEQFSTMTVQVEAIQWALCVLAKIRVRG